ncbi:hypothetical protein [Azotobacter beijerinckii]|uniref:hypothetical protein n=1 Tax=Azotobacter beijerinckii TaxID=170623 RepID=UPI0029538274|nr:hypothetical protein [Azotobacter beijerinckii]MDV7212305.1 hypothetical protein [Azotobacter beijerinckii]
MFRPDEVFRRFTGSVQKIFRFQSLQPSGKRLSPVLTGLSADSRGGFHGLLEPLSLISRRQEDPGLLTTTGNVLKASPAGAFSLLVSLSLSLSLSLSADSRLAARPKKG